MNTYTYDSANRLSTVNGPSSTVSYAYNGLGDRLSQAMDGVTTRYTLDLNTGLTQVLSDGTNTYTYGLGRISQTNTSTEYFLGDALGSVRQLTASNGDVTLAKSYDPYGVMTQAGGTSQSAYGYTGEAQDSYIKLIYLRSRMYSPSTGRFTSKDSWQGDYNRPLSLNRWNYVEGNPVNATDPSGYSLIKTSQILSRALSRYANSSSSANILGFVNGCNVAVGSDRPQYDLTGYLAVAMSKHGQDSRVKDIAKAIRVGGKFGGASLWVAGYISFYELEGPWKEWDIKRQIFKKLDRNIVLCGGEANCDWFDYSTPGNIHFGYVAGLADIDDFIAAILGGALEQYDLYDLAKKAGVSFDLLGCFKDNPITKCDNPQDQAAVDFGYELSKKYPTGISDYNLMREMQAFGMNRFQNNAHAYDEYWWTEYHWPNSYGADYFNN